SPLVPHLANCRFHARAIKEGGGTAFHSYTVGDSSVNRDYVELLFPRVVEYSLELMRLYFGPRIDVVPLADNDFQLINRSRLPITAKRAEVRAFYDDDDDEDG